MNSTTIDSDEFYDDDVLLAMELAETIRINLRKKGAGNCAISKKTTVGSSQQDIGITSSVVSTDKNAPGEALSSARKSLSLTYRKCVRFIDSPEVISRRTIRQHPSELWYTPKEMNMIFCEVRSLMRSLKHMRYDDNSVVEVKDCYRGLEGAFPVLLLIHQDKHSNLVPNSRRVRPRSKQNKFVRAVLDWQEDQKSSPDVFSLPNRDPIGLRMVSLNCSQDSRESALSRAAQDFLEVKKLWNIEAGKMAIAGKPCPRTNEIIAEHRTSTIQSVTTKDSSHYPVFERSNYSSLRDHLRPNFRPDSTRQLSSFF